MNQSPVKPQQLFKYLLYTDFQEINCIQQPSPNQIKIAQVKASLKTEITAMQRSKSQYVQLLEKKQRIKSQLKQLLNYRQSIDYDHKYKRIKFDHYQFPYTDNLDLKEKLNNLRLQNLEKKRKIKELEEQIKRKQRDIQTKRIEKQNIAFAIFKNQSVPVRDSCCKENFWIQRIQDMKTRHLNRDQDLRRAKIRHDYNLFVQRQSQPCACKPHKACIICSDLNLQEKVPYSKEALISPRYSRIYPRTRF